MPYKILSTWYDFYKSRLNREYFTYIKNQYDVFIGEISTEISDNMKVVELGCGIGSITKALCEEKSEADYWVIDSDRQMLRLTHKNLQFSSNKFTYLLEDIRKNCNFGDIAHSHGVLEHFNDKDIQLIIEKQLKYYNTLIHYVPSYLYKEPSFGDERLMTAENWRNICKPDEIIEFNNGYDLILKWKK